jgi:hypothetical protein
VGYCWEEGCVKKRSAEVDLLLEIIERGYQRQSWHGTNLRGSVRGLEPRVALWRPAPGRHNIYELVLHTAYWKYAVRRRLSGEKRGSFPRKGSNWFRAPGSLSEAEWREAIELLQEQHHQMIEAIEANPRIALQRKRMVYGIAAHDLYHAGQIQLLKRLSRG